MSRALQPKTRILLLPFVFFLALVGFDFLISRPFLRQRMRPRSTNMEILDRFTRLVLESHKGKGDLRPLILFLGTSRTLPFAILKDRKEDPFLSQSEIALLGRYRYEARLSTPLPGALSQLMVVHRILEYDFPIDTLVFDLSPFVYYNPEIMHRRWARNIYPKDFLLKELWRLPADLRSDALSRLAFSSYNFRLDPLRLFQKRSYEVTTPAVSARYLFEHPLDYRFRNQKDYTIPESLSKAHHKLFVKKTSVVVREIYKGFDAELGLSNLLGYTLALLQQRAQRVILWLPPTHPMMRELVYKRLNDFPGGERHFWGSYWKALREAGAGDLPFYNGYRLRRLCDLWLDASHLSPRCYGVLAVQILRCRKEPSLCLFPSADALPYPETR